MMTLSIFSAFTLTTYLFFCYKKFGITKMISATYYRLEEMSKGLGNLFSIVMIFVAFSMLIAMLDTEQGIQFLAFLGCSGLCFVGVAPNYNESEEGKVHKIGAFTAATGCVGWSLSVNVISTIVLLLLYLTTFKKQTCKWYWAELFCFLDAFFTYYIAVLS